MFLCRTSDGKSGERLVFETQAYQMLLVMSVALDLARGHLLPVGSFGTWGELVVLRLCPLGEPSRGFAFVPPGSESFSQRFVFDCAGSLAVLCCRYRMRSTGAVRCLMSNARS